MLSITVAVVGLICWQKNKKNGEVAPSEENPVYGSYARSWSGGGEYGDGDKVYVTDNNSYYGT